MDFTVVLTRDSKTGWFVAEVPNLPGCISQGKTKAQAILNIKDAVFGYLESMKKHPEEKIFERFVGIEAISV